jgi:enoyl-[acyl-carrier protein] reductase I
MVAQTLEISAYSLAAIARATVPLMRAEGSIVAIDFDADRAIPGYDWMGVAKSTLESSARYLAACLGPRQIRVNLVCAGPLNTAAASIFGGPARMGAEWSQRSPLGWDWNNAEPVAQACVALLSDWFPATTGERIHVDGGAHAVACSSPGPGSSLP